MQMRRELEARNLTIYRLQQTTPEFAQTRLDSEIKGFVQFVRTTVKKLAETRSLTAKQRDALELSAERFSSIQDSDNVKQKVPDFFDEVQNYCNVLIERVLETAGDATYTDGDDTIDLGRALHESEMQKLKLQNQLFRAERRLDEEKEENRELKEQIKSEHAVITQLTSRLFPGSPIFDDRQFVTKEVARIESMLDRQKQEMGQAKSQISHATRNVSEKERDNKGFTGDLMSDLKGLFEKSSEMAEQKEDGLARVASVLGITSTDVETIVFEILRCKKALAEVDETKRALAKEKTKNKQMGNEIQSLSQMSREKDRADTQNELLAQQVQRYKLQLATIAEENLKLKQEMKALVAQNGKLLEDQKANDDMANQTVKDLSEAKVQQQVAKRELAEMTEAYKSLQSEYASLTTANETLTRSAKAAVAELKAKRTSLAASKGALDAANEQIRTLKKQVDEYEAERDKFQLHSLKMNSVLQENQQYLAEMQKQAVQIAELSPIKSSLAKMTERCTQLTESLEETREAYEKEKEKVKKFRAKAREADMLSRKVSEFEMTIKKLNRQVSENTSLKNMCKQYEATVASLTTHSDSLQMQVSNLSSTNQSLMVSSEQASVMKRDSEATLRELTAQNRQLDEKVHRMAAEKEELASKLTLLTEKCESLTAENDRLNISQQEYIYSGTESKLLKEQNSALSEGMKTIETQNKTLNARVSALTSQLDDLQRRLTESEEKRRVAELQLETQFTVSSSLRGVEEENRRLRSENEKNLQKISKLQALQSSISSQMNTKASVIENLGAQLTQIQVSLRADKAKIATLETQKRSLESQLDTKTMIIDNYEKQLADLRESNNNLLQLSQNAHVMSKQITQLEAENNSLKEQYRETTALFDSIRARSTSLEMKLSDMEDLRGQVSRLKEENDDLMERNKTLERELQDTSEVIEHQEDELREQKKLHESWSSSFSSHLQAKSSIVENLQGENRDLAVKVDELEQERRRSISTISQIEAELRATQKENSGLTHACERLSRKVEKLTRKLSRDSPNRKR